MASGPDIASLAATHDRADMAGVIERTPDQIAFALDDPEVPALPPGPFDRAVLVGMGGSALPADVLNDALRDLLPEPLSVRRHYDLPPDVDERTLVVLCSFSGNTEETLGPVAALPETATHVVCLTAGGRLAEVGRQRGWPVVRIPAEREGEGFQPRCATGYIVTYLARILSETGLVENPMPILRDLVAFLREQDFRAEGEDLAAWIGDRIPVFYADLAHLDSIARIAKIKFNEHAKRPAFHNALPEANHNEMIGFTRPVGEFALLYFRDPTSHARIHERYEVMRDVFARAGYDHVGFREWTVPGSSPVERIFAALGLADWIAWAAALLGGLDPSPVPLVEAFKRELS